MYEEGCHPHMGDKGGVFQVGGAGTPVRGCGKKLDYIPAMKLRDQVGRRWTSSCESKYAAQAHASAQVIRIEQVVRIEFV
jgi:hypothetical protein